MPETSPKRACKGHIEGRVQGVSFRFAMQQQARRCGVAGWVRNTANGAVEFAVQGDPDAVQALLDWARQGPPAASVDGFDACEIEPWESSAEFEIRP